MPTTPRKAKILLKHGKAKVLKRLPFTIQLKYPTGEALQPVTLGIDSGYTKIGMSALTGKEELFRAEVSLRNDIVKLLSKRSQYRKKRRSRKKPYRRPKIYKKNKKPGWLSPSIRHKLDSHIRIIEKAKEIIPVDKIIIETGSFDIQKLKNPSVYGENYRKGGQKGFYNTREYVLYRDNHTCRHCKGKSKDPVLEVHHIRSGQTGGNRPDNLITLCSTCHRKVSQGKLKLNLPEHRPVGFKAETFMSIIRNKLVHMLRNKGYKASSTYGYITKSKRIKLKLPKSHATDAFIIAGGAPQNFSRHYTVKQNRRNNRRLQFNRKGYKPSIRRNRYKYQPGDLVKYGNLIYRVKGVFNYGTWIKAVPGRTLQAGHYINLPVTKIKLLKYGKGFVFEIEKGFTI